MKNFIPSGLAYNIHLILLISISHIKKQNINSMMQPRKKKKVKVHNVKFKIQIYSRS